MAQNIYVVDRTSAIVSPTDPAGILGSDPTGLALAGDTVRIIQAAYLAWPSVVAGDSISYDRTHFHDASGSGRLVVDNGDYITKDRILVTSHGNNGVDNYARLDQGTFLNDPAAWSLLDGSATEAIRRAAGSDGSSTPWVTGTWAWSGTIGGLKTIIKRLYRDSIKSGNGVSDRAIGDPLRMYERQVEQLGTSNGRSGLPGIEGMGTTAPTGENRGTWTSVRFPCADWKGTAAAFAGLTLTSGNIYYVTDLAQWRRATSASAYTVVDWRSGRTGYGTAPYNSLQNVTETRIYLFVLTGSTNTTTGKPTHSSQLNGMYVTSPTSDAYGILFSNVPTWGVAKNLWIRGCNQFALSMYGNTAVCKGVRYEDLRVSHSGHRILKIIGNNAGAKVQNDVTVPSLKNVRFDTEWTADNGSYISDEAIEDGSVADAWEVCEVTRFQDGQHWQDVTTDGMWHGAASISLDEGTASPTWPITDIRLTRYICTPPLDLYDGRGITITGQKWRVHASTFLGSRAKCHISGATGLLENTWFSSATRDDFNGGEANAMFDFTRIGMQQIWPTSQANPSPTDVYQAVVMRHNVIDMRGRTNDRDAVFQITNLARQHLPAGGITIANTIIIVDPADGTDLYLFRQQVGKATGVAPQSPDATNFDNATTGYQTINLRGIRILVDMTNYPGQQPAAVMPNMLRWYVQGTDFAVSDEFAAKLQAAGQGTSRVAAPTKSQTGNDIMSLQSAMFDLTAMRPLAGSPLLNAGVKLLVNPFHDGYNVDRIELSRGSAPSIGMYQTADAAVVTKPVLTDITPVVIVEDGADLTLSVLGANFVSGQTVVRWNNTTNLITASMPDSSHLTATIPAALMTTPGTFSIRLRHVGTGENSDATLSFAVTAPPLPPDSQPVLVGISPSVKTAGDAQFTLTVYGASLTTNCAIRWNGVALTSTLAGDGFSLSATITADKVATAGTATVDIYNASVSLASAPAAFTIAPLAESGGTGLHGLGTVGHLLPTPLVATAPDVAPVLDLIDETATTLRYAITPPVPRATEYVLYYHSGGAVTELDDLGSTGEITGLTAGTTYYVRAAGKNAYGTGPAGEYDSRQTDAS